jgi:hypothetical protein
MSYSGWLKKPRGRWVERCRHATEDGCWRLLLAKKVTGNVDRRVTLTTLPPVGATPQPGLFDQAKEG